MLKGHRHERHMRPDALTSFDPWLRCAIGALLLAGLSGCGQASPDPIERAVPNTPPSATTATSNHQNRPFYTDARTSLQVGPLPTPKSSTTDTRLQTQAAPDAARPRPTDTDQTTAVKQQWFAETRAHPEVTVRRQAVELWAEQPSRDLDPVTYALVDEDDSVRARAQALYEQQLVREAVASQPATPDAGR